MQLGSIQSLVFHQDKNNNYLKECATHKCKYNFEICFWTYAWFEHDVSFLCSHNLVTLGMKQLDNDPKNPNCKSAR